MNIFVLDEDPEVAARMLCNRHVSKMILESAQMLCSVAHRYGYESPYRPTHKNHPSTLWAGETRANWLWLIDHAIAMESEKVKRTGKSHKSINVVKHCLENNLGPKGGGLTPFALAMPERYRSSDAVKSYREYYLGEKQFFKDGRRPQWSPANPPNWWEYR